MLLLDRRRVVDDRRVRLPGDGEAADVDSRHELDRDSPQKGLRIRPGEIVRRAAVSHVVEDHSSRAAVESQRLPRVTERLVPVGSAVLLVKGARCDRVIRRPQSASDSYGSAQFVGTNPRRMFASGAIWYVTSPSSATGVEVVVISPFQFEEPGELFPGSSANHELVLVKRPDHLVLPFSLS